ncbi:pyridoxamine 5'-phosphate oxidase family protein [Sphingomonas bacterium]|uniref:pyridoxamine 5'-phosphate oxidase family protein n=1 Tax=Sphingomonas bacterium TaxID=1895847 RepID=UPI001575A8F1|nr:pyridoxamine 5'-phosphate oxidase family protein [Sphingomonas bacterium]
MDAILPASLLAQFDGDDLSDKLAVSAVLATVAEDGWPHLAYLSAGEVLIAGDRLKLRLWPRSSSAANLRRDGHVALHAAADGVAWEVRLAVVGRVDTPDYLIVEMTVVGAISHRAPYAEVGGMIGFTLHDEARTLARWEAQVAHLRSLEQVS